jgi:hypothetical protein
VSPNFAGFARDWLYIISRSCTADLGLTDTAVHWMGKTCHSGSSRCSERPEGRWRWCHGGMPASTWRIRLFRCTRDCHWTACCATNTGHCLQQIKVSAMHDAYSNKRVGLVNSIQNKIWKLWRSWRFDSTTVFLSVNYFHYKN